VTRGDDEKKIMIRSNIKPAPPQVEKYSTELPLTCKHVNINIQMVNELDGHGLFKALLPLEHFRNPLADWKKLNSSPLTYIAI